MVCRDDDDAANKWDEERRKLQELLAESDRQLADARQEVEAAREGGADMRRVRLANERLQEELGNLEAEVGALAFITGLRSVSMPPPDLLGLSPLYLVILLLPALSSPSST